MTEENTVRDPEGLLRAYNALKEEVRKISEERDNLGKEMEALKASGGEDVWRQRAILAETKSALASRGLKDPDRLVKVFGTDGLELNDKGELEGFDDRLKAAVKDFPELFDHKRIVGGRADIAPVKPGITEEDPMRAQIRAAMGAS